VIPLHRYKRLLREPDVAGAIAATIVGRLPIGMAVLAILLFVQSAAGSFSQAGAVSALYIAGVGALAPFVGRLIDRFGPQPALVFSAIAYPLALGALIAAVKLGAAFEWVAAAAIAAGASLPPIPTCIRTLLRQMLHEEPLLQTAYSLDSVLLETVFIVGPALVSLFAAAGEPVAEVGFAGVCACAGALLFLNARAVQRWKPAVERVRGSLLGPLTTPGLVPVLAITLCYSTAFGLFEVAVTGIAANAGSPAAAGAILGIASIGSAAGALAYGSRLWPLGITAHYRVALVAMAAGLALLAPIENLYLFALASIAAAAPMSVALASQSVLIARIAPRGGLAESFTWSTTCLLAGVSAGIALGGAMLERLPPLYPLVAAALATAAAVLLSTITLDAAEARTRT